ncbi:MAG TPA: phosphoribosylformylglycinamidine synthase subunit PurL [Armatimonadetes bacterium]|nr:phosphoribosylformylglycinamidine synthase subunit PurL [Armatimonadota bacterium]
MQLDDRTLPVSTSDDAQLREFMDQNGVGLTVSEARKIADFLGRDPTFTEMHIFNVEWSEHCSYKSSKQVLKKYLHTTGPNVMLGPEEDAGIVFFTEFAGKRYGIVMAHESHNHPSQVLPREGAATGIGGIVRDVDCMGARVIATGDPLRFGNPLGENAERTKWIVDGVVEGIWQYGNALGVPNLAGDVYFADSFDDNCLVNVVALGVVAEDEIIHSAVPAEAADEPYVMILVGKPTDDSGFGGSAFASKIIDEGDAAENRGAVQVDDPFLKNVLAMRKANEAVRVAAREQGIAIGIKDIGGGGIACGTSELPQAGGFGIAIDLDAVHVALPQMLPETITCAETQERYLLAVPEHFADTVLRIYNDDWDLPNVYEGARASVIGRITTEKRYVLRYQGKIVADCPIDEVTAGILYDRTAEPYEYEGSEPEFAVPDIRDALLKVLADPNICSRAYIFRAYDCEVQGHAVIRPGEAGAGVMVPLDGCDAAMALSVDGNPFYGDISPYWGGANAVAEAMRNVACVGAVPQALTDCLNFGNPEKPNAFWEFDDAVRGLSDAARNIWLKGYDNQPVPIISGNVSLYNESATGSSVSPSAIIACVGTMPDYSQAVTMQLKAAGDELYLIGPRRDELGGSAYYRAMGQGLGANVPQADFELHRKMIYAITDAIQAGHIAACTDIADGGLATAVAEMMLGSYARGQLGARLELSGLTAGLRVDKWLFSETGGFVFEVKAGHEQAVAQIMDDCGVELTRIGQVVDDAGLSITADGVDVRVATADMRAAWADSLAQILG